MTLGEGVQQFQVFVVFAVLGFALTGVYLFGMGLFRSRLSVIIFDAVFGSASIYAVLAVNLAVNNGEFRLFIFIGIALGCAISVFTCKTLLDKASSALYNLFTTWRDTLNDTHISQQKNSSTYSGGGGSSTSAGVYAAHNAVSNVVAKPKRGKSSKSNRKTQRSKNRTERPVGVYENRRIRKALGGKQRKDVRRRHTVDSRPTEQ